MAEISGAQRLAQSASATDDCADALPVRWAKEGQLAAAGLTLLVLTAIGSRLVPILIEPS